MHAVLCFGSIIDPSDKLLAEQSHKQLPAIPEDATDVIGEAFFDPACRLVPLYVAGIQRWVLIVNESMHQVSENEEPMRFDPFFLFKSTQKTRTTERIRYMHKLCGFTIYKNPHWILGVL